MAKAKTVRVQLIERLNGVGAPGDVVDMSEDDVKRYGKQSVKKVAGNAKLKGSVTTKAKKAKKTKDEPAEDEAGDEVEDVEDADRQDGDNDQK